jgi:hypothetical protein
MNGNVLGENRVSFVDQSERGGDDVFVCVCVWAIVNVNVYACLIKAKVMSNKQFKIARA